MVKTTNSLVGDETVWDVYQCDICLRRRVVLQYIGSSHTVSVCGVCFPSDWPLPPWSPPAQTSRRRAEEVRHWGNKIYLSSARPFGG
jgi:hypothetical protein